MQSFADQAVIAIENARLLNELRQRTADVTEALEQQTATSEVLRVISSSRGQLDPVFQTILANATRICDAKPGQILISPRVLTKVENAVKIEPVGEFELKGIRRPLSAYNVVGAAS